MLFEISEPNASFDPHQKKYVIGVDLGTTHSLIAVKKNGVFDVLANQANELLTPSAIAFNESRLLAFQQNKSIERKLPAHFVGQAALQKTNDPDFIVFQSFKRWMGQSNLPPTFKLAPLENSGISEVNISPIELSAYLLKHLKQLAIDSMTGELVGAVITVPAYFDEAARQATQKAAELAGLPLLRLLNEPTAAAIAYSFHHPTRNMQESKHPVYAVYDLGGGTFDISILAMHDSLLEVKISLGDTALGGDDFDQILAQIIIDKIALDPEYQDDASKKALSFFNTQVKNYGKANIFSKNLKAFKHALCNISNINEGDNLDELNFSLQIASINFNIKINAAEFFAKSQHLVDKTITLLQQAIAEWQKSEASKQILNIHPGAGYNPISGIILVGGASRMPHIRSSLTNLGKLYDHLDPDLVVALGAAMHAQQLFDAQNQSQDAQHPLFLESSETALLEQNSTQLENAFDQLLSIDDPDLEQSSSVGVLLDVISLSLGIETMGDLFEKIIERNSTIPIQKMQTFTTARDGQTTIKLHILQGEREQATDNRSLSTLFLKNIAPLPAGHARIDVIFSVDVNGLLTVSAIDQNSKAKIQAQLQPSSGLTEDELLYMLKSGWQYAEIDMKNRMLIEQKVFAEELVYAAKKAIDLDGELLTQAENQSIRLALNTLDQQIKEDDLYLKSLKSLKKDIPSANTNLLEIEEKAQCLKILNEAFVELTNDFAARRMNKAISKELSGQKIDDIVLKNTSI